MRRLLPCLLICAGCGGIRVGSLQPPRAGGLEFDIVPVLDRVVVVAIDDAVVNSAEDWSDKNLGDEDWLMAGASPARDAFWFTYLRFDLSILPEGTTLSSATLDLPTVVLNDDVALNVHFVRSEWDAESLTWDEQPRIQDGPVARLGQGGCLADCADLTRLVNEELLNGSESLSLVVVPARPWEQGFRRWNSSDTFDDSSAFTAAVPRLTFEIGDAPPASSAAALDRLRGIE